MFLEIIITLSIGLVIYVGVEYLIQLSQLAKFPSGPFPLPLIGNLHQLGMKPHESLKRLSRIYGDVFSLSFGSKRIVVVNGIKPAREALLHCGEDLSGRPQDIYTGALVSRNFQDIGFKDYGPDLKLMRKIAHSALKFYGNGLENLEHNISTEVDELFRRLDEKIGVPIDPYNDMGEFILLIDYVCYIILESCDR